MRGGAPVGFGIIQRYVVGEVARAFALALLTMTAIFVLFMVMAEAARMGLSPRDILTLVPFVIPGTLPYTVPVSLLFAVSVVYGRLAGDNEIVAVKTAGLSAMTVLWPTIFLGGALSLALLYLSALEIPRANHNARLAIFKNMEEMFYKFLKKDREFNNQKWPFLIKVRDVEEKTMIQATFKRRSKSPTGPPFDMIVQASRAVLTFDMDRGEAHVYLDGATVTTLGDGKHEDIVLINNDTLVMPLPDKNGQVFDKRIQEWTTPEMVREQAECHRQLAVGRKAQAILAAFQVASGRPEKIDWPGVKAAFVDYGYWSRRLSEFETEQHLRIAQSVGSLVFVLLGAPVGIRSARRDFLSAFITCFVPIIIVYYPLMLLGVNMGREDLLSPVVALWSGNFVLCVLAGLVLPPVIRH
jgi:lipopolysaccharide export system permease protein